MFPDPAKPSSGRRPAKRSEHGVARRPTGPSWMTALAFLVLAIPFGIMLARFAAASGKHLALADDLALIDFHTRQALRWRQELGVFDHNNWNHPGPSYFYLLSLSYRLLGPGARAEFFGATLINALAALACLGIVRHRTSPARTLWAAVWIGVLAAVLATAGAGSLTYSEGPLGALVSPWNPTVVIFPLVLFTMLCAASLDRSALSLIGALIVGSFAVQTDISTFPLVAVLFTVSALIWSTTAVHDRNRDVSPEPGRARAWWIAAGSILVVAMWVPPTIQQFTNHPGNFTLIWRFFTAGHPGQTFHAALWSVVAANAVVVVGPSEIMTSLLGGQPRHAVAAVVVTVAIVLIGAVVSGAGIRQRRRFAAGLGILSIFGIGAATIGATHIVGAIFGYLLLWEVTMPIAALIGLGMVDWHRPMPAVHRRPMTSALPFRLALSAVAVAMGAVLSQRVSALPSLRTVSDPMVARLVSMVSPSLSRRHRVFVGDNGVKPLLPGVEQFVGLVNQLDERGYHPRVNSAWRAQFGIAYLATGHEATRIELDTWSGAATRLPGYVGRVGYIAVTITGAIGHGHPPTAVRPG
ncbi:MAG: hypothetical protein ACYCV7_11255 [Acidimicrobiales bacterium]